MSERFYTEHNWVSVSLKDAAGQWVTELPLEDFHVTESLVSPTEGVIAGPVEVDIVTQSMDKWTKAGFWERTVSDEKLDLVLLLDDTGSMGNAVDDIRAQVDAYIDRLIANHVDFRVGGMHFAGVPNQCDPFRFYGTMELDELSEALDQAFISAGESWTPTCSYDAILFTPWLGWRDDARKICVVFTDIVPQTVYTATWGVGDATAATLPAVESLLSRYPDMELYYCLNPEPQIDIEYNVNPDINPWADNDQSGFAALETMGLATGLRSSPGADPWPFDQSLLPMPSAPIQDSSYYLAWESTLDWITDPEDSVYQVTVTTPDPDAPGSFLEVTYSEPRERERADVVINTFDEEGHPIDDVCAYLYYPTGNRRTAENPVFWGVCPVNGTILQENVPIGRHLLIIYDSGKHSYKYESLRAITRQWIDVPIEGLAIDVTVGTADKEADLAKARGLLKDLKDWEISGRPFKQVAQEAEAWLDAMEGDGVTWQEMVALKRFFVGLSGYANMGAYAKREADDAIVNFEEITTGFIRVIDKIKDTQNDSSSFWDDVKGAILEAIYDILTRGEFTIKKEAVEEGLERLLDYALNEALDELKQEVVEQIPAGPYKDLLQAIIFTCAQGEFDDWDAIIDGARKLAMDLALEEVTDTLSDSFVDEVFADLDLPGTVEKTVANRVRDIVSATVGDSSKDYDETFDNLDEALEQFAKNLVQDLGASFVENNRADVIDAIDDIFDQIADNVPDALPDVVDNFLLGMVRDFAMEAARSVDVNTLECAIDSEKAVRILVKYGLYHVVLKHYFVDETRTGLKQMLYRAQMFVPEGETRIDWERGMLNWDFTDYHRLVSPLQDVAWNAIEQQEDIDEWGNALHQLVIILEPLSDALDFIASIYPDLEPTADNVDGLIIALDGFQVLTEAIEFGLRIDSLNTFGNRTEPLYEQVFPGFEELKPAVTLRASDPTAAEGANDDVAEFTFKRTGNTSMDVVVNYKVSGTAQNGFDYYTLPGAVLMRAGHESVKVRVKPIADRRYEGSESVVLVLDEGAYVAGSPNTASATIEDENLPGISIQTTDMIGRAPAALQTADTAEFTVSRAGNTSNAVAVHYDIAGTADNGADFKRLSGTVTIPAGQVSAPITVTPLPWGDDVGRKTVILSLAEGDYALGGPTEAQAVIGGFDVVAVILEATDDAAVEGKPPGTATFTFTRLGDTSAELEVGFLVGGSATISTDYAHIGSGVTIPAGETSATVTIEPYADGETEGLETVRLTLLPSTGSPPLPKEEDYIVGLPREAIVTIADPSVTPVGIGAIDDFPARGPSLQH